MKLAILDMNAIGYSAALSTKFGTEPNLYPDLYTECRYVIAKTIYALYTELAWDQCIGALDSKPYWREKYMADFYIANAKYSANHNKLWFDNSYRKVTEEGLSKPLAMKDLPEITDLSDVPTDLQKYLPTYKGNRRGQWALDIPKEDISQMIIQATYELLPLMKGIGIEVKGLEADDVAAIYATHQERYSEVVLVTKDKDWMQLMKPGVDFYDLYDSTYYVGADNTKLAKEILQVKLLAGDTGDNISGVPKGNKGCWGVDGVKKAREAGIAIEVDEIYRKRQIDLIKLPAPQHGLKEFNQIQATLNHNWQVRKKEGSFDEWGFTDKLREPFANVLKVKEYLKGIARGKYTPEHL